MLDPISKPNSTEMVFLYIGGASHFGLNSTHCFVICRIHWFQTYIVVCSSLNKSGVHSTNYRLICRIRGASSIYRIVLSAKSESFLTRPPGCPQNSKLMASRGVLYPTPIGIVRVSAVGGKGCWACGRCMSSQCWLYFCLIFLA